LVATAAGWNGKEWSSYENHSQENPYQTVVLSDNAKWVFFRPCGNHPDSFRNIRARINASDGYPGIFFPGNLRARGVDLRFASADLGYFGGIDLTGAVLDQAGVQLAYFGSSTLDNASMNDIGVLERSFEGVSAKGTIVSTFGRHINSNPASWKSSADIDLKKGGASLVGIKQLGKKSKKGLPPTEG
jgi:hypothetical protein